MSISEALFYPFRNNNLFKILPIAIVYAIIAFLASYASIEGMMFIVCGAAVALLIFSFVLGGYYISIIEAVQLAAIRLPDVAISRDLSRGVAAWLAGILYGLPMVLVFCVGSIFPAMLASADEGGMGSLFIVAIAAIFIISMMFFLGLALVIGYNRYAAEGTTQGLFALTENFGIAWNNAGLGLGLILRSIAIGLINFAVVAILQLLIATIFPQQFTIGAQPTTLYWIGYALLQVVSYTISLIFLVSQYHLVAHYGMSLGITADGRSVDRPDSGLSPWVIVAVVVGLVILIGAVAAVALLILGPSIEAVYSELMLTLTTQPR